MFFTNLKIFSFININFTFHIILYLAKNFKYIKND